MEKKSCCFIGHRRLEDRELVYIASKIVIGILVKDMGVRVFNFGSKSEFDDVCHFAVTEMQVKHPDIVRVGYHCRSEYVANKEEKEELEKSLSEILKKDIKIKDFDKAKSSDRIQNAGKASYVERNQEMIDDSDYCVFFYKDIYTPESAGKNSKGNSGTKLAYDYALKKGKTVINIAKML